MLQSLVTPHETIVISSRLEEGMSRAESQGLLYDGCYQLGRRRVMYIELGEIQIQASVTCFKLPTILKVVEVIHVDL